MNEEEFKTIETMLKYGGGFVKSLANCFHRADVNNFKKLKNAFPKYWEKYNKISKEDKEEE